MRKFMLLAILIAMSCRVCLADGGNVELYNDENEKVGKGNNSEIPVVNYNNNEVTLTSVDLIDAYVVIRDADGDVITEEQMLLSPTESTIAVPEENVKNGCVIEISYEENSLYGFIN